jgi:hypothetical protein
MKKELHQDQQPIHGPSKTRIFKASIIALLIALILLFVAILPAEYGIDPFGIGQELGILTLSEGKTNAHTKTNFYKAEADRYTDNEVTITLAPREGKEYKFLMEEGSGMLYSWSATQSVDYEFHGEPKGAPKGKFQSFEKKNGKTASGSFLAPFAGRQGWYWENKNDTPTTVTVKTVGYYQIIGDPKNPLIPIE